MEREQLTQRLSISMQQVDGAHQHLLHERDVAIDQRRRGGPYGLGEAAHFEQPRLGDPVLKAGIRRAIDDLSTS